MLTASKTVLVCLIAAAFSGCASIGPTGNNVVDAVNYGAQGLVQASATRQQQSQKAFEQALEKKLNSRDK